MNTSRRSSNKDSAFCRNLNTIKEERNLSISALALMAEVEKSVMQGWLNGSSPQDPEAVDKLAQALGLGFRELYLGKKETQKPTDIAELFNEEEWFEGICKVKISRLKPKDGGNEDE